MTAIGGGLDIASLLTQDEIPIKLRCTICSKLALNAFRLPCCDQSICDSCQVSLPSSCPVCEHSPLSADDCKPNKALRTTIKVFLRTAEKKRESLKEKVQIEPLPAAVLEPNLSTPAASVEGPETNAGFTPADLETVPNHDEHSQGTNGAIDVGDESSVVKREIESLEELQKDVPRPTIEVAENSLDETNDTQSGVGATVDDQNASVEAGGQEIADRGTAPIADAVNEQSSEQPSNDMQDQMFNNGSFGFDGSNFPNMGWNGPSDYNSMMQAMQNGMPGGGWGNIPNMMGAGMGMGMGMDPMMMSQGVYGGFGGQGMGMNGMGMGMNFNAGQGGFGSWNGQSWNQGQDNFNPNANAASFGANYGYPPVAGAGYNFHSNNRNFNQMHSQHFQRNNFQSGLHGQDQSFYRGGRGGRGGFGGRGGYGQTYQPNSEPFHQQLPAQMQAQKQETPGNEESAVTNSVETSTIAAGQSADPSPDGPPKSEEQTDPLASDPPGEVNGDANATTTVQQSDDIQQTNQSIQSVADEPLVGHGEATPQPIPTFDGMDAGLMAGSQAPVGASLGPNVPSGPAALQYPNSNRGFGGRGGMGRGFMRNNFRGRGGPGFFPQSNGIGGIGTSVPTSEFPGVASTEPKGLGVEGAPTAPRALREGLPNTGFRGRAGFPVAARGGHVTAGPPPNAPTGPKSEATERRKSPSRSRSPARERRESRAHSRRRHRSRSPMHAESDSEDRREKRHRSSRRSRHHSEDEDRDGRDSARAQSPVSSVGSTRAYSRDDRSRRSSHKQSSSHRRHRDHSREHRRRRRRSRSPSTILESEGKEREVRGIEEDETSNHRSLERLSRHEHKRSRRERSEQAEDSDYRRRHRSHHSRRDEKPDERRPEKAEPEKDIHTLEREARNRERLLKEQQRRDQLNQDRERKEKDRKRERNIGDVDGEDEGDDLDESRHRSRRHKHRHSRRDGGEDEGENGRSRRVSYKYEDDESDEARALRIENEREAARWG